MKKVFSIVIFIFLIAIFPLSLSKVCFADSSKTINLSFNAKDFYINLKEFEVNSNIHTVIWQASRHNRKSSVTKQASTIQSFLDAGAPINQAFDIVYPGFEKEIKNIEKQINSNKIDATYYLSGNQFVFSEENVGYQLDKTKLYYDILSNLKLPTKSKLEIPVSITNPSYKVEDLKKATNLRSSFQTDISKSSAERKNNIALAIKAFDKKIIYPGQTISFNETTGPRTKKYGYKEAKIIINGKYVEGFGGGVCQASTTIYNACILAGLDCKANCHTIPPSYVPKGLDAMVNSGTSDLKITNNLSLPIYINATCTNNKINVKVFGESLNGKSYRTKQVILEEKPSKGYKTVKDEKKEYLAKVKFEDETFVKQYATNGFKTATYLQEFQNNKLVNEKLIRKDVYPPSEGIIIQGTQKRPAPDIFEKTIDFIENIF